MSQRDERFRKHSAKVFYDWQEGIATALRKGQSEDTIRRDLDVREAASFLIATYEGYVTLAKNAQDVNVLKVGIRNIVGWLDSIRMPKKRTGRVRHEESEGI
jgi:TetR/AcrR family transcriptional regulator, transcriptional repressor for nem operon